jgi:hypothetical protein
MLVSQAEYARRRGVSRQYIGQMVAKGVIRLTDRKVDPDQANVALAAVREPARTERSKEQSTGPATPVATPVNRLFELSPAGGDLPTLLLKSRIKSEIERSKLLEIKARVEAGRYVDAEEVKAAAFNKARVVRDGLLNIPDRLSAVLAAENNSVRIHEVLSAEIRAALEELTGGSERG